MKLLAGSWNFHVWNPKPLLFMIDFIRQSLGLGGIDTWFVWFEYICLDLVYQLECLLYDIRRLYDLVFHFFWNFMPIWILVKYTSYDQDVNKFNTWKWKGKHGSFLVTLKWCFWRVLEISKFETQNHFSSCLTT